jgi:hypothetical protein
MADANSPTRLYARTSNIIATDVAGEVVLLNPASWSYYDFDKVGTSIWTLLEVPRSLPSLVEALMVDFNVDEARCRSDTKEFLDDMIGQGLVTVVEG